jgi:mannose-1-phosphate guanylyltransferase
MTYYAVIMAGGTGTRLWPLSRRDSPKQSLRLLGDSTMFQSAVDRIVPLFGMDRIIVVCSADQIPRLARQVPELPAQSFLAEPAGRGTAPCIALASVYLRRMAPDAVMAVVTADHVITETTRFRRVLESAREIAEGGSLVTLGIRPAYASTGYGYIEQGEMLGSVAGFASYRVEQFTEKPDEATAAAFVASGRYSWNSGMFIWRVDTIMEEFRRLMPTLADLVDRIAAAGSFPPEAPELLDEWHRLPKETIDYGVMEQARDIVVIPADIGWSDIGSWSSLAEMLPADEEGNTVRAPHVGIDTRDTLILGGRRLIATIGLDDMIVVDTEDAVLVCRKDREQSVREIVRLLEREGDLDHL